MRISKVLIMKVCWEQTIFSLKLLKIFADAIPTLPTVKKSTALISRVMKIQSRMMPMLKKILI